MEQAISADEGAAVRSVVFAHLGGMALAPTCRALWDRGVFDLFKNSPEPPTLDRIAGQTQGHRGYLHVALRLLASQGWMRRLACRNGSVPSYELTDEGTIALRLAPQVYAPALSFLPQALFFDSFLFGKTNEPVLASFRELVDNSRRGWGLPSPQDPLEDKVSGQIRKHADGLLTGPAMVALARGGVLDQLQTGPITVAALKGNPVSIGCVLDLLSVQGWLTREGNRVSLTPRGQYAARIAASYGVTVSYLPMFNAVSTLLFGNARMPRFDENGVELLVNRGMNVWGSGGAHKTYFKKVDEIILDIFNRPLNRQPQGICDMGCGDGSFLEHLYQVIAGQTARGRALDRYPLTLIGADFNKVARRYARQTLRKAKIPNFQVIHGDINRPAQLAGDLERIGLDIHDLLHVRSFLDHNRPYLPPANYEHGTRTGKSTGAFAHFGEDIPADELEENLVRHLRRWSPYAGRFGLLLLELHTLPPPLTAANLEKTPAVAYDGTHGYSDQYLVELPVFLDCAREAGLEPDPGHQYKFPASELATVSLNFFRADSAPG